MGAGLLCFVALLGFSGCDLMRALGFGGDEDEPEVPAPAQRVYGVPVAGAENMPNIKYKFGVAKTGQEGVKEAFLELGAFIQNGGLAADAKIADPNKRVIQLGNWIALEDGLKVEAYGADGNNKTGDFVYSPDNSNWDNWNAVIPLGSAGRLNQLVVAGINSFNAVNGNNTPHVVFQFQNIPVSRRMNPANNNTDGYLGSEMREYLVPVTKGDQLVEGSGNFLAGLVKAGVPEGVLWGPKRLMAGATEPIEDLLWLPTKWEMSGNNTDTTDTATDQARLEYYNTPGFHRKGSSPANSITGVNYWLASVANASNFCFVNPSGNSSSSQPASNANGVAPAFCVQGWIQQ
jgi:hypothetical protein